MTTLYFSPGACSLSPHIALREAGLPFSLEQVDLATKKTKAGADFLKINPKGQVPVLRLEDGEALTEGPAIVQYIADQAPASGLAPANGTIARYHLQEWLNFVTSELHKNFTPLFKPNTPEAYKAIAKETLAARFAHLDKHLAGRQYLLGDKFTVADAYCFTVVGWSKYHAIDLAQWPNLKAFMDRVAARPKVQEAMKAEGLLK
ncbi:MAG TPA: glutathione transferase GstA [Stellaceae bacterium]|nr:glutathione transferase GstA [Stellaceae bacterium]